jgi:hypothetical protein
MLDTSLNMVLNHPASSIQYPTSRILHPVSSIQYPATRFQHPAIRIPHIKALAAGRPPGYLIALEA